MAPARKDVESSLNDLRLSPDRPQTPPSKKNGAKKKNPAAATAPPSSSIADSWEDDLSSGEDTEKESDSRAQDDDMPGPPPPTPMSPTYSARAFEIDNVSTLMPWAVASDSPGRGSPSAERGVRPDKTDAMAKRLIAGALGVRAPAKTDEQKQYEKAVREKELRKREREREERRKETESRERAKAAVWDD